MPPLFCREVAKGEGSARAEREAALSARARLATLTTNAGVRGGGASFVQVLPLPAGDGWPVVYPGGRWRVEVPG
ncbi:MAG: hypothetical protein QG675_61 [Patescibacteria group bacterium]|jgi:hypothetical protein|nr:hypothetical protein [Patescibacteria group bacterium]